MNKAYDRGKFDWAFEVAGALAVAAGAAFAGARLAPTFGWPLATGLSVGFAGTFAVALLAARLIPAEAYYFAMPDFDRAMLVVDPALLADDEELLLDTPLDELLLDRVFVGPETIQAATSAVAELLLDDPLPAPDPGSRVVQLFADGRMPTPGQLQQRIDCHLGESERPTAVHADASDSLSEALAELRRSLRQA